MSPAADLRAAVQVHVAEPTHASEARRAALRLAGELGFDETAAGKLALVVTEVATNLLKHATRGRILLSPAAGPAIDVFGLDNGPGMANLAECLRDGYSTAGSPGTGLGAILRLSDASDIFTAENQGAVIYARCGVASVPQAGLEIGGIVLPYPGCTESGDAWSVRHESNGITILMADGLGHGPIAAEAGDAAVRTLRGCTLRNDALLTEVHRRLASTRGAAAAVAEIDPPAGTLRFTGVGNISGVLYGPERTEHLVSMNGIVGHRVGRMRVFESPWTPQSILIFHSDGLRTNWKLEDYRGLRARSAAAIAGVLLRDAARGTDDASVVVVRAKGGSHAG